ncbi:MAG: hypothetical protein EOP53_12250 [Sphingobacteriales bacterium]|nr:MAG: hypothetical protein EOP53_12250 [Sphingobacteriales bacterium]
MKKIITSITLVLTVTVLLAQNVGVNNTNPQTSLDINGALRNRATSIDVTAVSASVTHNVGYVVLSGTPVTVRTLNVNGTANNGTRLLVYNSTTQNCKFPLANIDIAPGILAEYIYDGAQWKFLASTTANTSWDNLGNYGINPAINFLGTMDNSPIPFRTNNVERMRLTNTGLEMANEIKPAGVAGTNGQVLQSNGDGTMSWKNAAYNNNTRFYLSFTNVATNSSALATMQVDEVYNINLVDVEVNTTDNTFTIYKTGLYHFDYDVLVNSTTFSDPADFPSFNFHLLPQTGSTSHPPYRHYGNLEPLNKLKNYWGKVERGSFSMHIDATVPAVYRIQSELADNNNASNTINLKLRCHLVSE